MAGTLVAFQADADAWWVQLDALSITHRGRGVISATDQRHGQILLPIDNLEITTPEKVLDPSTLTVPL